jgi:hypothetical protein
MSYIVVLIQGALKWEQNQNLGIANSHYARAWVILGASILRWFFGRRREISGVIYGKISHAQGINKTK